MIFNAITSLKRLLILLACCLLVSCATYIPGGLESKVKFHSNNEPTFEEIFQLSESTQTINIEGRLFVPKKVSGKIPAVIILHGVSGVREDNFELAAALNKIGVAAFIFDSNEARNVGTDKDPTLSVSDAMRVSDAFGALKALQSLPIIDKNRAWSSCFIPE